VVIFHIDHYVKPDFVNVYKSAVWEDARNSIQEDGILRFEVFQDTKDPFHFTLVEVYRDMQARQFHLQTPYLLKFRHLLSEQGILVRSESNQVTLLFPDKIKK
jgi:autoinducer 2-degrading protein